MPLTTHFTRGAERRSLKQKDQAIQNLLKLLPELQKSKVIMLHKLGIDISFHNRKKDSGASNYPRGIELNLKEFSRFTHKDKNKPSHNQRWALATLKEEVIHYLEEHFAFDRSREWKKAVTKEFNQKNPLRDKLLKKQRKHDSSDDEIKLNYAEYSSSASLQDKLSDLLHGENELAEEFLVDVLLTRDYLNKKHNSQSKTDQLMQDAFPHTYELALSFENKIEKETNQIAKSYSKDTLVEECLDNMLQAWNSSKDKMKTTRTRS